MTFDEKIKELQTQHQLEMDAMQEEIDMQRKISSNWEEIARGRLDGINKLKARLEDHLEGCRDD